MTDLKAIMICKAFLVLLILVFTRKCECLYCQNNDPSLVATEPADDIFVEYGKSLVIFCSINLTNFGNAINSKDLIFKRNNEKLEKDVSIVNETTIKLEILKPESQQFLYECALPGTYNYCHNLVIVDTKPQKVKSFDCKAYDFKNLTCSWKSPQRFAKTTYSVSYSVDLLQSASYKAQRNELDTYSITLHLNSSNGVPFYRQVQQNYTFTLTAENALGKQVQNFTIDQYACLIPSSPRNLEVFSKTSNSAVLRWQIPADYRNHLNNKIDHKIEYQTSYSEWKTINNTIKILNTKLNTYELQMTDLYPHMGYGVRVFYKSGYAPNAKIFWSPYASKTFYTENEPPKKPPETAVGGFDINKKNSTRNIYIYWKQLEEFEKNGDNFEYVLKEIISDEIPQNVTQSFALFTTTSSKALNVFIKSTNSEGSSPNASNLFIPAEADLLKGPTDFTRRVTGHGSYELSWNVPETTKAVLNNFTLFWCSNDMPYMCGGRLNFQTIPRYQRSLNLSLPTNDMYQFAISANSISSTSGMVWAKCTLALAKDIGAIRDIRAINISSHEVTLRWSLECSYRDGFIRGYTVEYCRITKEIECNDLKNVTIMDPKASSVDITNLKPYTSYSFKIAVMASNFISDSSYPYNATTSEDAPTEPLNVTVCNIKNTSMNVSWKKPIESNGPLYQYIVYYDSDTPNNIPIFAKDYTAEGIALKHLNSYCNYSISVVACTASKCSKKTQPIIVRTAIGPPSKIDRPQTSFKDKKQIYWRSPKIPGGNLDFYEVNITKVDGTSKIYRTKELHYDTESLCEAGTIEASVRAINYDNDTMFGAAALVGYQNVFLVNKTNTDVLEYNGPWSEPVQFPCDPNYNTTILTICSFFLILIISFTVLASKRVFYRVKTMKDIKITLPPGLNEFEKDKPKVSPFSIPPDKMQLIPNKESGSKKKTLDKTGITTISKEKICVENADNSGTSNESSLPLKEVEPIPTCVENQLPVQKSKPYVPWKTCFNMANMDEKMLNTSMEFLENLDAQTEPAAVQPSFTLNPLTGYYTKAEPAVPKDLPVPSPRTLTVLPTGYARVETDAPEKTLVPSTLNPAYSTTIKCTLPPSTSSNYISHTDSILNKQQNIKTGPGNEGEQVITDPDMPADVYSRFSWEPCDEDNNLELLMSDSNMCEDLN